MQKVTPQQQQIVDRCKAVFAVAKQLYPHLDFDKVGIRFDLKGRAAGMACRRSGVYFMRFNRDMLTREAFDHVYNDTVPHEIAHIVCFMDPKLGRNHDYGWASVCRKLGGNGQRTHREEVVYGKGLTYEYTTTQGVAVRVSQQIHAKVQRGQTYVYRSGKGQINKSCAHQVVGANGQTLKEPVRKVEAKVEATAPTVPANFMDRFTHVTITDTRGPGAPTVRTVQLENQKRIDALKNRAPVQSTPVVNTVRPVQTPVVAIKAGGSKADIARAIMRAGFVRGDNEETMIGAIMLAAGLSKQLAKVYFKNNVGKL